MSTSFYYCVKMATTGIGFRWLDILEKEFDKACVELDTSLADLESEDGDLTFGARQKIATLSSCFAQLTHKALTIFQHSAKLEAELVDMRADLVQARAASAGGCREGGDAGGAAEGARARAEAAQLARENAALRDTVLALHSELYGARLATKYLDKELAGRIQQLQLLGRDMRAELRDSLWAQVEAEILLQRHKTLVRVCRGVSPRPPRPPPAPRSRPRTVRVRRSPHLGLGISVTGGREHGVPILISELEAGGPAALTGDLYVGDAILAINDVDLTQACHKEAVAALQSVKGDCALCVQFIAADDDDHLSEDNYRFPLYPDDGSVFGEEPDGSGATPTAPRTPDYNNRPPSVAGSNSDSESRYRVINSMANMANLTNLTNLNNMANMANLNNMANMANLNNTVNMNTVEKMVPVTARYADYTGREYANTSPVDKVVPAPARYADYAGREYANMNNLNNNLDILDMDDDSIKIEARIETLHADASPRRRGGYLPLPPRASPPPAPGAPASRASSASLHSTPVHQRRLALKKKRKPQDWRTKGAYRALAPDAVSSDEPLAGALDDDVIVTRGSYPAIVSDSLPKSSPPHDNAAVPSPSPPPVIAGASSLVSALELTREEIAPYMITPPEPPCATPADSASSPPPSPPQSAVAPLVDLESTSKPNGDTKPQLRRESKGFRIGSARRVVEPAPLVNGERRPPRAPHPPPAPRLLPGHGDPDFGTPV